MIASFPQIISQLLLISAEESLDKVSSVQSLFCLQSRALHVFAVYEEFIPVRINPVLYLWMEIYTYSIKHAESHRLLGNNTVLSKVYLHYM